jgi:periplasmic protein TonB
MIRPRAAIVVLGLATLSFGTGADAVPLASQPQDSSVSRPVVITRGQPIYPAGVDPATVNGEVHLDAIVESDGSVKDAVVVKSIPQLDSAAVDAARRYRFRPAYKDGAPIPVIVRLEVAFRDPSTKR